MTSESWRGDVHQGVAAWTRQARGAQAEVGDGTRSSTGRSGRRRGGAPVDTEALGPDADPESVARTILLDQLTGRARSRHELAEKLAGKGVPDDVAVRMLDRFEEIGLIDDEAFARMWISGRQSAKGLARRALAQELRRKGIADEVARDALDEVDPADEEEAARALVRRKLRSLSRVDDVTATRRLVGMLARKGYGPGLAHAVVREELAGAGRDDDVLGDLAGDE
ncbi:regulatory protein RecX [Nocardioides dongxiaopingii]|uniref:regulatory protein RecX n=1 Tax=Nocardioides dongxiaopingii TaxID=2576036 RepID=UPI0010C76FA3|nr:regulatory protein RecX [Nocardioides dongxiaopingii]